MAKNIIAWKTKQRSYQFVVFAPAQTVAQLCVFRRWKRVLFSIGLTRRIIYNCRYTSLLVMLYLSSIVKYGFVRDIPGRSENAVPMVYRHARRRSLLKVAVCQPLGLRDIILARAAAAASLETFSSTSCCGCVAKAVSIGEVRHQLKNG